VSEGTSVTGFAHRNEQPPGSNGSEGEYAVANSSGLEMETNVLLVAFDGHTVGAPGKGSNLAVSNEGVASGDSYSSRLGLG
jgi:hypothetical protein